MSSHEMEYGKYLCLSHISSLQNVEFIQIPKYKVSPVTFLSIFFSVFKAYQNKGNIRLQISFQFYSNAQLKEKLNYIYSSDIPRLGVYIHLDAPWEWKKREKQALAPVLKQLIVSPMGGMYGKNPYKQLLEKARGNASCGKNRSNVLRN